MIYRNYLLYSSSAFMLSCGLYFLFQSLFFLISSMETVMEWEVMGLASSKILFILYFDWISCLFYSFVSFITSSVLLYSGSYMEGDKNLNRFIFLVLSFVGSMFFVVFSLNMVSILLGWDGLGLTSYLLVIYYMNEKSSAAGMLTALSNRIGDVAILMTIALMVEFGSWNFMFMEKFLEWDIMFLVILASMTKSAQMPFSAWLPAAMAAPTPVSALVHSSTLVTAGVYLLIRFSYSLSDNMKMFLFFMGSVTTLMASLSANLETDMKKVIALSTLSQLGLMMSSLGLGMPEIALFHLLAHATFKALLFMCVGKIIHESNSSQDGRSAGGLSVSMPYTCMCMNLSNLALCGIPFMAGFYSKDMLLELGMMKNIYIYFFIFMSMGVGLSATYSVRFSVNSVMQVSGQMSILGSSEKDSNLLNSKLGLSFLATSSGALLSWVMFSSVNIVVLSFFSKMLALVSVVMGVLVGLLLNSLKNKQYLYYKNYSITNFIMMMWFLPWLSGAGLSKISMKMFTVMKSGDSSWSEKMGGQGIYQFESELSGILLKAQKNSIKTFLTSFGLSVILIFSLYYLGSL